MTFSGLPKEFKASKDHDHPLEIWPYEYELFYQLSLCVGELADLDCRHGEPTVGHSLKMIHSQVLDLVCLWSDRYEQQERERSRKDEKPTDELPLAH